jgi:protein TonB
MSYLRTHVDAPTVKIAHDVNDGLTLRDQFRYANYIRSFRITEPQIFTAASAATPGGTGSSLLLPPGAPLGTITGGDHDRSRAVAGAAAATAGRAIRTVATVARTGARAAPAARACTGGAPTASARARGRAAAAAEARRASVQPRIERPKRVPATSGPSAPVIGGPAPEAPPAPAAPQRAEPLPSAAPPSPDVLSRFERELLKHLERQKRYPRAARMRREQSVVYLSFTMDRAGAVLSARIERGSGYAELDEEVLALIRRAAPLSPFPPDLHRTRLELVVPVQFRLR